MLKRYFDPLWNAYRVNVVFLIAHSISNGLCIAGVIRLMAVDRIYGSCALIGAVLFNLGVLFTLQKSAKKLEARAARLRP